MISNIFPPENSLKNLVVNILIEQSGLTVEKIKSILYKNYSKKVTYQGISKVLHLLNESGVAKRVDKKWYIDESWSKNTAVVLNSYDNDINKPLYSKELKTLTFTTPGLAWEFFLRNLKNGSLRNEGEKELVIHIKNFGYFGPDKEELKFLKAFAKETKITIIVENNNVINRYVKKYLDSLGIKVILGIAHSTPHSTVVYGNTVILMYFTNNDLIEYLAKMNNKIKTLISSTALRLFTSLRDDDRFHFKLIFNTDKEIAKITKEYLLKLANSSN